MLKNVLIAILVAGALLPGKAFAWDEEGHKIVALIADHYLDPAVKQKVDAMLAAVREAEAARQTLQNFVRAFVA